MSIRMITPSDIRVQMDNFSLGGQDAVIPLHECGDGREFFVGGTGVLAFEKQKHFPKLKWLGPRTEDPL